MKPDGAIAELVHATKQVVDTNHEIIRLLRAGMQQEFKLPELQKRWNISRARLLPILQREAGYVAHTGEKPTVNIAHVLRIDRLIEETHGLVSP
jgi:hypothetical protein